MTTTTMVRRIHRIGAMVLLMAFAAVGGVGCRTSRGWEPEVHSVPPLMVTIAPGDEVEVRLFGAPELSEIQTVRRDGRISLPLIGEVDAAGRSPEQLKEELTMRYSSQLQQRDLQVVVRPRGQIYVVGAVMAPGTVPLERPLSAFEAVMEAGGFDFSEAHVGNVLVIRNEGDRRRGYLMDLDNTLRGEEEMEFYLQPMDVVFVPRTRIARVNQWVDQYINRMLPRLGLRYDTDGTLGVYR